MVTQSQSRVKPLRPTHDADLVPLIIDLETGLIQTSLAWERALSFVRAAPWRIFVLLAWLIKGRAVCKTRLSQAVRLDAASLPVNESMAALAAQEYGEGRPIHLAASTNEILARQIGKRFSFIDRVFACDEDDDLNGAEKASRLVDAFPAGFIYAGGGRSDLHVQRAAADTVVSGASSAVLREARRFREPIAILKDPNRWSAIRRLLRPHQWSKNALVFVPAVLGGVALYATAALSTLLAFMALSLVASGTYVLNDLIDLDDDRRHWTKRNRPLASGAIPIPVGIGIGVVALGLGFGLGALSGVATFVGLIAYFIVTVSYSFKLKRIPILDVLTLAGLFTLRLAIGTGAAGVAFSPWLLTFSMFLFLSLSLAKRHTEIARAASSGKQVSGRGYVLRDEPLVLALGIGALVASVLVFVIYLTQEAFVAAHLASPKLLWMFPPALFLLAGRIWLLSGRGELDDDPVSFAIKDRTSLAVLGALGIVVAAAWIGVPS